MPCSPQNELPMRILLLILLLANLGFFAYHHLLGQADDAGAQIALLQINPEKIMPLAGGPVSAVAAAPAPAVTAEAPPAACIEWGAFSGTDVARADAALAALALPAGAAQRRVSDVDGYWVHMPVLKTKAEVDRKVGELKALGVEEFFVVQEAGPWRNAVSLGLFKSEDAAKAALERLRERGVRSALVTRREKFLKQVVFFVREPAPAIVTRLTELQRDFPATEVKAGSCPVITAAK